MQRCGSASIIMQIRIQDPKNIHANLDPDSDPDPRVLTLNKKNFTKIFSAKSFKTT